MLNIGSKQFSKLYRFTKAFSFNQAATLSSFPAPIRNPEIHYNQVKYKLHVGSY